MVSRDRFFDKNKILFFSIAFGVLVLDQITKYIFARFLELGESVNIIGNFLRFTYIQNTGSAFGIFSGQGLMLAVITAFVVFLIIFYYPRYEKDKLVVIMSSLILGGALGNFIDRISFGYVRDFINFNFWPAFNVADMGITIGVVGLIIYLWKK